MKATPLISSTLASAVVFLLTKSWMVKGQRWSTLFLEKVSLFSITTTLQPNRASSMAARRPQGPPPMTRH
ncbi:hypothetical protein EYF80_015825 [Liparis tanakae]|uniref:Uncharacterized protein n=1 Tax=Liparis tanakae TaxID=230148 RepID=A0A4Z2I9F8_9TELE|nr:hypothetical protein EYF80_015825 [Liparis tanakae]